VTSRERHAQLWVSVDQTRCSGHARCNDVAPDFYTLDDDGYSDIGAGRVVPSGAEAQAVRGVEACPERALELRHPDGQP
jgi:ferredoxin